MSIIEFKNVYKSYGDKKVLENFNLTIEKGEFVTVIGSSGSGKTTALKLINGLIQPDSGEIFVNGVDISKMNQTEMRRNIGYVIQGIGLFPHLTVEQNICYVLELKGENKESMKAQAKVLIKTVGLDDSYLKEYPSQLSGGQQQRIGIARALAANPDILLMDEPFGAVDGITRCKLQSELMSIWESSKITVFFITHDVDEAFKMGSRIIVMHEGAIQQTGNRKELAAHPANDYVIQLIEGHNIYEEK